MTDEESLQGAFDHAVGRIYRLLDAGNALSDVLVDALLLLHGRDDADELIGRGAAALFAFRCLA